MTSLPPCGAGRAVHPAFKYRAFISYSHTDKAWAEWLHRRLERYRVPRYLVGTAGRHGPVPRRIGRCFRDDEEMSAASGLGEALEQALRDSAALVIVCSPRAAQSRWVNEEIRCFRSLGRGDRIHSLVVAGVPEATGSPDGCFPPALLEAQAEPLAVDVRAGRDDKGDAFVKIAAALLGVGYDDLRRREQRRRNRWLLAITGLSAAIAGLTLALAVLAVQARNEARFERDQAAGLVSFMLGDLKVRLEQFGRLDVLDAAVSRTVEHLAARQASPDAQALAARSEALAAVAEIRYARGDLPGAIASGEDAVAAARQLMERAPGSAARARLAGALYALGEPLLENGAFDTALPMTLEGRALARELLAGHPDDRAYRLLAAQFDDQHAYIMAYGPQPDVDAARAGFDNCVETLRPAVRSADADSRHWRFLLRCHSQRSSMLRGAGRMQDAADSFRAFLAEAERAPPPAPGDRAQLYVLQRGYSQAATMLTIAGQLGDARRASTEALRMARQLAEFEPDNVEWGSQLGIALRTDALVSVARGEWGSARARIAEGIRVFDELLARNAAGSVNLRLAAMSVRRIQAALDFREPGRRIEAVKHLEAALRWLRPDDSDVDLQIRGLEILLQRWLYVAEASLQGAGEAEGTARRFLAEISEKIPPERTAFSRAALGYLEGRIAESDADYAAVNAGLPGPLGLEPFRTFACARLARQGGRCPALTPRAAPG
jgi:eukaryotic-like serine/threonine-protein kinase